MLLVMQPDRHALERTLLVKRPGLPELLTTLTPPIVEQCGASPKLLQACREHGSKRPRMPNLGVTIISRNAPCFCNSGKKYKHCHGDLKEPRSSALTSEAIAQQRSQAKEVQRQRIQGFGKPIISGVADGIRSVVVGNQLMQMEATQCRTFHDFLHRYIRLVLGKEFCTAEDAKPPEQKHPIMLWESIFLRQVHTAVRDESGLATGQMTGAAALFLRLAYDLYALAHNVELQAHMLDRIRQSKGFNGARHEVFVAACFTRSGFDIEFEDESSRRSRHHEFNATFRATGRKFSVEAKRRESNNRNRFGHLVNDALAKPAKHERIIFLEMNWDDPATGEKRFQLRDFIVRQLRRMESAPQSAQKPPAYVFVTNNPHEFDLEGPQALCSTTYEGYKIPSFKGDAVAELREVIRIRELHAEMFFLVASMNEHAVPPVDFDGELPGAVGGRITGQLMIGDRIVVPDGTGGTFEVLVEDARVDEANSQTMFIALLPNGNRELCTTPMSEAALNAWKKHPDTYFGVLKPRKPLPQTPIELYDYFFERALAVDKATLLQRMSSAPDIAERSGLDQRKLASLLALNQVMGALRKRVDQEGRKFLEDMGCSLKEIGATSSELT